MASLDDSVDWSKYPPDRVEGLKYFRKGPSSDEDGPCTEEELKMLCVKWNCRVDMKIDNFLFWLMKKTKERDCNGDHNLFVSQMPKYARKLRKKGLEKYQKYQEEYGEVNRKYLLHCAEWRQLELRHLRWLDKLSVMSSTWSRDDSEDEEEDESDREASINVLLKEGENSYATNFSSNSSVMTVIDTLTQRYNSYPETESIDVRTEEIWFGDIGSEEEIDQALNDVDIEDVNSQLFIPQSTSTQKDTEKEWMMN